LAFGFLVELLSVLKRRIGGEVQAGEGVRHKEPEMDEEKKQLIHLLNEVITMELAHLDRLIKHIELTKDWIREAQEVIEKFKSTEAKQEKENKTS
jgi:hypothetical protein